MKPPHTPIWSITYNGKGAFVWEIPKPSFSKNEDVIIRFINVSGSPVIMGIVSVGRVEAGGTVDTKCSWIPDAGERDSGLMPLANNSVFSVPPFKVTGDLHDGEDQCEFVYSLFVVDDAAANKFRKLQYHVLGKAVDPHVIITS
jgi:hypothetical protein